MLLYSKKTLSRLLLSSLIILSLCFSGCASSGQTSGNSDEVSTVSGSLEGKKEIVIGCVGAMSGASQTLGFTEKTALDFAIEDINNSGGINGLPVRIVYRDDEADPTKCLNAVKDLVINEKIDVFIGPTNSTCGLAIQPYLTEMGILHFHGGCTGSELIDPQKFPYTFRIQINNDIQAEYMVTRAVEEEGFTRIALVNDTGALGTGGRNDLKYYLKEKYGLEPVADVTYIPNEIDMLSVAQQLKDANPEIILSFALGEDGARIVKSLEKIDFAPPKVQFHGYSGLILGTFPEIAGSLSKDMYANGLLKFTYTDNDPGFPDILELNERIVELFPEGTPENDMIVLSNIGAYYDCMMVIKEAIEATQSVDGKVLTEFLEGDFSYEGYYATSEFSPTDHEGSTYKDLTVIPADLRQKGKLFYRLPN